MSISAAANIHFITFSTDLTMKKRTAGSIRRTITRIALSDINEEVENFEDQMTSLDIGYTEEYLDEEEQLEFVKEIPKAKLRNFLAHPDLLEKMNALRPHMALYCEYAQDDNYEDSKALLNEVPFSDIYVSEILLTGSKEKSGVVMTGFKVLRDGNRIKLQTPNISLDMSEYQYVEDLSNTLDELAEEARAAIVDKKCRIVQASLFDEDADPDAGLSKAAKDMKEFMRENNVSISVGESAPSTQ